MRVGDRRASAHDDRASGMHGKGGSPSRLLARVVLATLSVGSAAAVEQTIPTAPAGTAAPLCTVGRPCTFAAPIFACDYDSAQKIAEAGPAKGNEVGMELMREKSCQAVPAGRPLGTEATKSPQVVYATEAGQHLGYLPVGVFGATETAAAAAEPERRVPIRVTTRGQDLMLYRRGPAPVAVRLSGQGTSTAVGLFRSGPAKRRDYCANSVGDSRAEKQRCLGQ